MGKHKHSLKSKKYKGGANGDPAATDTTAAKQETPAAKKNSRFSKMKTGFKTGVNKLKTGVKNLFTRKGKKTASSNSKPPKSDKNAKQNVNDKSTKKQKKNKVSPDPKSQKSAAAASSTEPVSGTTAPTSTTTSTITEPIPVSTPGGQGTLMDVFTTVYSVLAAIGLVVLVTLFVLNTLDIIRFSTSWAAQTFASYFLSKDIFNKDTIEMQLLEYHKYDSKEEPYTIFLQQYIAQFMFLFGAFTAVLIVINLCVYGLLMLYFKLRKYKDHGESLNLVGSFKNFVIIGLTVLSAGMIYVTYKYWFQKSLQKKLINSNKTVQDITQKIYTHMTTNTEFIANLINSTEKQDAIQSNINIMNKVTGTDKIEIIARMIFTSSVYNYFKNIIPGKDEENYNNVIKPMFLQKEGSLLFPTNYMYYQQNMFIPNDYNNIINHIFGEDKVIKNKAEDVALVSELNKIFTLVNSTSKHMYRLPKNVPTMFWYFLVNFIIICVIMLIIAAVYGTDFKRVFNEYILGPCNKLSQLIISKDICTAFVNIPEETKTSDENKSQQPTDSGKLTIVKTTQEPGSASSSSKPVATPSSKPIDTEKDSNKKKLEEPKPGELEKSEAKSTEEANAVAKSTEEANAVAKSTEEANAVAKSTEEAKAVAKSTEEAKAVEVKSEQQKVTTEEPVEENPAPTKKSMPVANINKTAEQVRESKKGGKTKRKSKKKNK